jgi:glycosyltransferase involved in cell wall biosynthesis
MVIVFFSVIFPVKGVYTSGAGNYVANMADILARNGHRVIIVTESERRNVFFWNNIEVRQIKVKNGFVNQGKTLPTYKKFFKNIRRSLFYNWEVYKINKKVKVDVVQSVNSFAVPLFRLRGIPYIVRVSDFPSLWSGTKRENYEFDKCLKSKRIDEEISCLGVRRADRVIAPSYLLQDLYYKKTYKKPTVIESPIIMEPYNNLKLKETEFKPNKYIFTYGAMNYRKEIHIIAKIIDDILDKFPDIKYVVAGQDIVINTNERYMMISEYFKLHITRNYDRFVFLGEISDRHRLFSIVKNAYICVLPTRIDNLPNTILESMALGKVIVSSTCEHGTSVEQLITDGENGFLAQVDDAQDLYNKIVQAMELTQDERTAIENRAKDRVKDLTPDKVYEKMMGVYTEVITNFKRRERKNDKRC